MRWPSLAGLAVSLLCCHSASSLALDPTDPVALRAATKKALSNLISHYHPNRLGVFDEVHPVWWASGSIWVRRGNTPTTITDMVEQGTFADYHKWSGDDTFAAIVTGALVNVSCAYLAPRIGLT
jgi:hypothetical protein